MVYFMVNHHRKELNVNMMKDLKNIGLKHQIHIDLIYFIMKMMIHGLLNNIIFQEK